MYEAKPNYYDAYFIQNPQNPTFPKKPSKSSKIQPSFKMVYKYQNHIKHNIYYQSKVPNVGIGGTELNYR